MSGDTSRLQAYDNCLECYPMNGGESQMSWQSFSDYSRHAIVLHNLPRTMVVEAPPIFTPECRLDDHKSRPGRVRLGLTRGYQVWGVDGVCGSGEVCAAANIRLICTSTSRPALAAFHQCSTTCWSLIQAHPHAIAPWRRLSEPTQYAKPKPP